MPHALGNVKVTTSYGFSFFKLNLKYHKISVTLPRNEKTIFNYKRRFYSKHNTTVKKYNPID